MITIVIRKTLENHWLNPEEEKELTDVEIIELVNEDLSNLLEDADFTVERS